MSRQYRLYPTVKPTDFMDKSEHCNYYVRQMLARTQSIFKYTGLPDTIPQFVLEYYLQSNGNCIFAEHEGGLYVYTGGLGGEPDVYYLPTVYTVANPAQKFSKEFVIGSDCVLVKNDSMLLGLIPMFTRYASLLVENDISFRLATINTRIISILSAEDARTAAAGDIFLKRIAAGEQGVITESAVVGGFRSTPFATAGSANILQALIEFEQYIKASWYNDIGLQANFNMKRERIGEGEAALTYDGLLPLIDDMLNCRKNALEQVNSMFNTDISVELNSSWEYRQEKIDLDIEAMEAEIENSGQPENTEEHETGDSTTEADPDNTEEGGEDGDIK